MKEQRIHICVWFFDRGRGSMALDTVPTAFVLGAVQSVCSAVTMQRKSSLRLFLP
jgi:hypothetical protein